MTDIKEILGVVSLFRTLSEPEVDKLIADSDLRIVSPGEPVIRFGQPGRFIGVVLSGEVEVTESTEGGERHVLATLSKGEFFGEMSLMTGEPSCADVIALQESRILMVPYYICSRVLADRPEAVTAIVRMISTRLRNRRVDERARHRVEDAWKAAPDRYGLGLTSNRPARILVINCGSSSLKYNYYDTLNQTMNREGLVERIGSDGGRLVHSNGIHKTTRELGTIDHDGAFEAVVDILTDDEEGVIRELTELTGVGHRVVHGGSKYSSAVLIDDDVVREIDALSSLAPLHNPPNLTAIRKSMALMPEVPQVAVFDTAFHQKMPKQAFLYALPYRFYEEEGIRRYGFHGISHNYLALKAASHLRAAYRDLKIITCHLGNGASICAIDHGRSVDTSMGLTPLEGLVMGTRCGDLDPGAVLHIARTSGMTFEEIDSMLNRQSGVLGLSGISNDFRELEEAASQGDHFALMALHVFCYRIRKYIGAYMAAMGGVDVLVFAGGIGERSPWVRGLSCQGLDDMGIEVDDILNRSALPKNDEAMEISTDGSRVRVLVIPTDEGRMIARETIRALGYHSTTEIIQSRKEKEIPIRISVHHVHLSPEDADILFGKGYELTCMDALSQPGLFACEEHVDLEGPRGTVAGVSVYFPPRARSQVEVSHFDESLLGIRVPIRRSGDTDGSPGITIRGPEGTCKLKSGVIRFHRHIHMTPEDALMFGLKDGDMAMVRTGEERGLIFDNVLVRVDPDFELSMHIDVDEANAANVRSGMSGELLGIHDRR
jgi:acetate kinase